MIGMTLSNWKNRLPQIDRKYDLDTWRTNEILSTQFYIERGLARKKKSIVIMIIENVILGQEVKKTQEWHDNFVKLEKKTTQDRTQV